ncbi:SMP-30/gluconolactonase/LRE family protein [Lacipirellula sp.]|uniref:SMP-30/gluconolactonase/LRE family protein n=1 Tax=Lacipirellula sp. TaxID=2691419 RepID=UPI003D0A22B9
MKTSTLLARAFACVAALASLNILAAASQAQQQLLVADRLSNSVFRYSASGTLLGTVLTDNVNLLGPSGITLSPDQTKLFVTSTGNNVVVQYDYSVATGLATNGSVFADAADGLSFPSSVKYSQDGSKVYVSNLGGTGVAQFNLNGTSAGAPINGLIGGGTYFQFSGLEYAPNGELLVGAFQNFPAGNAGAVAKSNVPITGLSEFIPGSASLNGASGLLVRGNDLYVTGMFAGTIGRYNVLTGAVDPSFGVSGLAFPQGLIASPDGNGFLAGILGVSNGSGNISHYAYDGTLIGTFALPGGGGFIEPTAFATVAIPEPATLGMLTVAVAALGLTVRRRMA